jgi:hypothetical protein
MVQSGLLGEGSPEGSELASLTLESGRHCHTPSKVTYKINQKRPPWLGMGHPGMDETRIVYAERMYVW